MPTTTLENGKAAAVKLAHLTAKASEGKMLVEDLVEIGKRKAQKSTLVREAPLPNTRTLRTAQ